MGVTSLLPGGNEPGIENEAWRQAEHELADHLRRQPDIESARVIGGVGGDGGKDVIAKGVDGTTYIAEAKHWASNKVHRKVVTGHADRHGTDGHELIVYAADNGFTGPARTAAENHGVRLLTADDLGRGGLADALRRSTPSVEQARAAMPSTNLTSTEPASRDTLAELGDGLGEQVQAAAADLDVRDLASRGARRGARATGRGLRTSARLTARALWKGALRALGVTRRVGERAFARAWMAISWVVVRLFVATAEAIGRRLARYIENQARRQKLSKVLAVALWFVMFYVAFRVLRYVIRRVFYTDDE